MNNTDSSGDAHSPHGRQQALIDFQQPAIRADPYPTYARMRRLQPVCRVEPDGLWALSRYDDIKAVLRDHRRFSSRGFEIMLSPPWFADESRRGMLLAKDPPEHTRLRHRVNKAFTGEAVQALLPAMEQAAEQLLESLSGRDQWEFLSDFSYPFVGQVVANIVGLPAHLHGFVKHWVELLGSVGPQQPPPAQRDAIFAAHERMSGYARDIIAARRGHPRGDLMCRIVNAEMDGELLSEQECLSMLFLLVGASFDTTINLLTNCMRRLAAMPELVPQLYANNSLIAAFVEEILRFDPPSHALLRQSNEAVQLHGVDIPAGELIYLLIGSAGRDEQHYPQPDKFQLQREQREHLSFGHGAHVCIGMLLARLEARVALTALLRHASAFHCPPAEQLHWRQNISARGVDALPLTVVAR